MLNRQISTEGIILQKRNFGEHDQFVTFFSPDLGKTDAVAKGARKINSPYIGHLEILNICQFQLYKTARSHTIIQCQARQTFKPVRTSYEKSVIAILLAEIFHKTSLGAEHTRELFELLQNAISHLCSSRNHPLCLESFKIKLLNALGVLPQISHCGFCRRRWQESDTVLIDNEGRITCGLCRIASESYRKIPFNLMKLINYAGTANFRDIESVAIKNDELQLLKKFADIFLNNFSEREIISEKIFNAL